MQFFRLSIGVVLVEKAAPIKPHMLQLFNGPVL